MVTSNLKPREVRKRAGLPLIAAAVGAGVAEATARIYEADRDAVSPGKRAALDAFYARLGERPGHSPEAA
jgi:hypothetical protein